MSLHRRLHLGDLWASDAVLSELIMGGPPGPRPNDIVDKTGAAGEQRLILKTRNARSD